MRQRHALGNDAPDAGTVAADPGAAACLAGNAGLSGQGNGVDVDDKGKRCGQAVG